MPFPWAALPFAVSAGKSIWDWARGNNSGPSQTQTTTTGPDARSQQFIDRGRGYAQNAYDDIQRNPNPYFLGPSGLSVADQAAPFMNPFQDQVIGGIQGHYDMLRGQAGVDSDQSAIAQGAFGGSRAAQERGARLGALDVGQAGQVGNLLYQGHNNAVTQGLQYQEYMRNLRERQAQEPIYRRQMANQLYWNGLGPVGQTATQTMQNNPDRFGETFGALQGLGGALWEQYGQGGAGVPTNYQSPGPQQIFWPEQNPAAIPGAFNYPGASVGEITMPRGFPPYAGA